MTAIEIHGASGHPAPVLAKKVIDAIEAYVAAGKGTYADVARGAYMSRQQLKNIQMRVAADPEDVIKSDVAERLARSIGMRVDLVPAAPEKGGGS